MSNKYSVLAILGVLASLSTFGNLESATLPVPSSDYNTINDALMAANVNDTVEVSAGTYYEDDLFLPEGVTLQAVPNETVVIEGSGNYSILSTYVNWPQTAANVKTRISGITFQSGNGSHNTNYGLAGGGLFFYDLNTVVIENCTFQDNLAVVGGGIYAEKVEKMLVKNCDFLDNGNAGNSSTYGGAGMYLVNIDDGNITTCDFDHNNNNQLVNNRIGDGGGLHCNLVDVLNVNNCAFTYNKAYKGGGLHLINMLPGTARKVWNGTFTSNNATWGGGLYCANTEAEITQSTFQYNSVVDSAGDSGNGGGLWVGGNYRNVVSYCTVANNTCSYSGGGVRFEGTSSWKKILYDCDITNNTATGNVLPGSGGGLSVRTGVAVSVYLTNFLSNSAPWDPSQTSNSTGGAVSDLYGDLCMVSCVIDGNYAGSGGGVYINKWAAAIVTGSFVNCSITDNWSTYGHGGGMYNQVASGSNGKLYLTNTMVSGNTSNRDGGGMFLFATNPYFTDVTISDNFATGISTWSGRGGGMFLMRGQGQLSCTIFSRNTANYNHTQSPSCSNESSMPTGGGVHMEGISSNVANINFENCLFAENSAEWRGGGIFGGRNSVATVVNCTLAENQVGPSGSPSYTPPASPNQIAGTGYAMSCVSCGTGDQRTRNLRNNIFFTTSTLYTHNYAPGVPCQVLTSSANDLCYNCSGTPPPYSPSNFTVNPGFVTPLDGFYKLSGSSLLVNANNYRAIDPTPSTDCDEQSRPQGNYKEVGWDER